MKTFEELLREKIVNDITNYVSEDFILTNDINLYSKRPSFKGTEIVGVIRTGGGETVGGDVSLGITQNFYILLVAPLNKREDLLRTLTDYCLSENKAQIQTLQADLVDTYTYKTNYTTPTTSGLKIDLNGYDYIEITIGGQVFFGDFNLAKDTVKIGGEVLNNVVFSQKSATPQIEAYDIAGMLSQLLLVNSVSSNHTFRVLYNEDDELHLVFKNLLDNSDGLINSVQVEVNDKSYNAIMLLNEELTNGFSFITITLQKTGVY